MDKKLHDLLVRYVNGDCTEEEKRTVNQWYESVADNSLHLDDEERELARSRMLSNIRKSLAAYGRPAGKHRRLFPYRFLRAAAAILVVGIASVWLFRDVQPIAEKPLAGTPESQESMAFINESDSARSYTFPDGSTVQLGPESEVRFHQNFSEGKREVYLTGKGFFDVVKDPSRPFYVYSRQIATRVLGTSFLVDAPENGTKVEVQVITGKVSVFQIRPEHSPQKEDTSTHKKSTANGVVLSPNQKVEYYTEGDHWVTGLVEEPVPVVEINEETLSFVFDNTPVKNVLSDIYARFGIEVVTENDRIGQCTFTGDVSKMTLYDMLDVISNTIGSTYEVKGTRILMSGKGCDGFDVDRDHE